LKVYQGLGQFIRLPAHTPQALLDHLASQAGPDALAVAETAAEATLAALQEAIVGRAAFPPWPEDGLPVAESLALIRQALAEGQALEMDYYTAGRDVLTQRVVEPYRLEQRGQVRYLVGFCHRAQAERVFRLDRIYSIVKVPLPDSESGLDGF
jgi:proteasome accessory factor C